MTDYEVIGRSSGRRVATFSTDPYEFDIVADAGAAVQQALQEAEDMDQMNRTTFDGDAAFPSIDPEAGESTEDAGGTSMESYQDPSPSHRASQIAKWIRTGYLVQRPEDSVSNRASAATQYDEGQKVMLNGERALVVEIWTSGEREGPDGETYEASDDSPVFVIATQDGAEAVTASDLDVKDWSTDRDNADQELAETVAGGDLEAADQDFTEVGTLSLEAGPTDWDYPESWKESDTPSRLILLDAWSSMGGQFDCGGGCCKGTMLKSGMSDRASDQFCASMKDRVLLWEGWRRGG